MTQNSTLTLVADVGGTNTRVALAEGPRVIADSVQRFANDDFKHLEDVLLGYQSAQGIVGCSAACVAMAGPVAGGTARLTNRDWSIDTHRLSATTGAATTAILNDLQAQGHAVGHLKDTAVRPIITAAHPAPVDRAHAARLVIGIGTGFNIAPVFLTEPKRLVPPSEAGHALLPVVTEADAALARALSDDEDGAVIEDALSGRGIVAIDRHCGRAFGADGDRSGPQIIAALEAGEPHATATAAMVTRMMGLVAGNLALTVLPYGGIYLIGGVARAFAPYLSGASFTQAFGNRGRFSDFMAQFDIATIDDDYAALTGCAAHVARLHGPN